MCTFDLKEMVVESNASIVQVRSRKSILLKTQEESKKKKHLSAMLWTIVV